MLEKILTKSKQNLNNSQIKKLFHLVIDHSFIFSRLNQRLHGIFIINSGNRLFKMSNNKLNKIKR